MLCNILTTILQPNFEEPIDTAKQLNEQNITVVGFPFMHLLKKFLQNSNTTEYQEIGEKMIVTKTWEQYNNMTKYYIIGNGTKYGGTHAMLAQNINKYENGLGIWHRSKEYVLGWPSYVGYLSPKKWYFNEV